MDIERKELDLSIVKQCGLPVYWVLGGPGSGKGTQCAYLARVKEFVHLSSGDLLREEVSAGTPRGLKLYSLMEAGEMVPSEIVLDLVAEAMVHALTEHFPSPEGKAKGFLLDGYPYKLEQAAAFEARILHPTKIVYLSLDQDKMIDRLIKRGNFDDNREAIEKRCAAFQEETRPVLEKYADKVVKVDADDMSFLVTADITAKLEEKK